MTPSADVIIAVHDPARPIARAVGSVLNGSGDAVRVTVVAHNTPARTILDALSAHADDSRLRVIAHADGIHSPAGPFNAGLDAAEAPFTSVMGSDDTVEPGAVNAWLARARATRADVVIARLRHADGRVVPTPPTRPGRRTGLDGVRDRLSYRSAPLGLVSTTRFGDLRFTPGRVVGEDVPYVTRLWFSDAQITYARRDPAYVIHADVAERSSMTPRPVAEELSYLDDVLDADWFRALPQRARRAFCVKALRIHLFGAVWNRQDATVWTPAEREGLAERAHRLLSVAPTAADVLSRRDRDLLDRIADPSASAQTLIEAARRRRAFGSPGALIPRRLRDAWGREAPVRMAVASAVQLL